MSIYENIKAAVTMRQVAERYGPEVNRSGMACCPFHEDRHPSLKINDTYFYCFGCGASGDVIDYVARLFGLSLYGAARKLAEDLGIDADAPRSEAPPAYVPCKEDPLLEILCRRLLTEYLAVLRDYKVRFAPRSPLEDVDPRYGEACNRLEYIEYLLDCLCSADKDERAGAMLVVDRDKLVARLAEYDEEIDELIKDGEDDEYEFDSDDIAV